MDRAFYKIFKDYKEVSIRYDAKHQAIWFYYNPTPRPCFSMTVLKEIRQFQEGLIDYFKNCHTGLETSVQYLIIGSQIPDIYNLGGDLSLFMQLIKDQNRLQLLDYAKQCIDICYLNAVNLHLPITTISLVEGAALGGGFESALSSNIMIATENSKMGFPEIRFNLFPGMGAYSLLARIVGMTVAEKMIAGGEIYSGRELYDMGIVHHLVENDNVQERVEKFLQQHRRLGIGRRALQQVRQCYSPIDYQELSEITEIWVDAALRLEDKDLRMMDRLARAQLAKVTPGEENNMPLLRTKQDRRFVAEDISFPLTDWAGDVVVSDRRENCDRRLSS